MLTSSRLLAGFGLLIASSLIACGGDEFSAPGDAVAGAGGAAGSGQPGAGGAASGQGGEGPGGAGGSAGPEAGGAGEGGAAGQGGEGGAVSGPSCVEGTITCGDGTYCNTDTGQCVACTDLTRLEFAADSGSYLAVMTGAPERSFPRVQMLGDRLTMLLRVRQGNGQGGEYDIASVHGHPFESGQVEDCCVTKSNSSWDDSGPLLLPAKVKASSLAFVHQAVLDAHSDARFVFLDSERDFGGTFGNQGRHALLALRRVNGDTEHAYWQVPLLNTGRSDYSVAYAYDQGPPRFYWMSERWLGEQSSAPPALYTIASNAAPGSLAKVNVSIEGCPGAVLTEDLAPWVVPDGSRLFFHARCSPDALSRLYSAPLSGGQFAGPARPLGVQGLDQSTHHRTPSLSPDLCSLYLEADHSIFALRRR